jgi:glycosyltransferase involved in cell wall biosynthesis
VYNCEKYLSPCLTSIVQQTYKNIEIIIVNDGSTDGSEIIVTKYQQCDSRIFYFYQENKGPSQARNYAILSATGKYIVFIDADDTVEKYYIERLLKKMISSCADLGCCGYSDISIYGTLQHTDFNFEKNISLHSFIELVCKGTGGVLWGKIYKREIIRKNKLGLEKDIFMSEDLLFVLRYATYCKSFVAINEYLYNYNRLNQASLSANISLNYLQNYFNVCRYLEKILSSVNLDENKIKNIITERIQNIVVTLVEQQSINLKNIGFKNAIQNVKQILSSHFIKVYKYHFTSESFFYKPFLLLLKNNFVRTSILYGAFLNILRSFKTTLKRGSR